MKIQTQVMEWITPFICEVRVTDGKKIIHFEIDKEEAMECFPFKSIDKAIHKLAKKLFMLDNHTHRTPILNASERL